MRQSYNSFKYWETMIGENNTIRGHMFMTVPPKSKSLYIHTLIFSNRNGMDNIYGYFPDEKVLLGYIRYSFLQEAFYKWIYGKKANIKQVPVNSVEDIIKDGLKLKLIGNAEANLMKAQCEKLEGLWALPKEKIISELIRFSRKFNKTWFGDNKQFLYLKVDRKSTRLNSSH